MATYPPALELGMNVPRGIIPRAAVVLYSLTAISTLAILCLLSYTPDFNRVAGFGIFVVNFALPFLRDKNKSLYSAAVDISPILAALFLLYHGILSGAASAWAMTYLSKDASLGFTLLVGAIPVILGFSTLMALAGAVALYQWVFARQPQLRSDRPDLPLRSDK